MNDIVRQKLSEIITEHGVSLIEDVKRCEDLLTASCGKYTKEVSALITACRAKMPWDLLQTKGETLVQDIKDQFSKRLVDRSPLSEEESEWAIISWAIALGIIDHCDLGDYYRDHDELDDAIREYQEAIRIDPDRYDAHYRLGYAYYFQHKADDAIREYKKAIRIEPDDERTHLYLFWVYDEQGRLDDAILELKEILKINPNDELALKKMKELLPG